MKSRCKISMTKRIFTTLWVLCLACKLGFGQDMVLSGTVKDVQGSPMPGVAVLIKGTTLGVVTQNDGTYSLSMGQADKDAVLVFSFLGFKTQELKWNGKTVIDVTLEEERQELEGVVVTALGIKREEKGLGYSTQTVTEKMMSDATPTNWASALVGSSRSKYPVDFFRSDLLRPDYFTRGCFSEYRRQQCLDRIGRSAFKQSDDR